MFTPLETVLFNNGLDNSQATQLGHVRVETTRRFAQTRKVLSFFSLGIKFSTLREGMSTFVSGENFGTHLSLCN